MQSRHPEDDQAADAREAEMVNEIARLRAENDQLRKTQLCAAINDAVVLLPNNWSIAIVVEPGSAFVELITPVGKTYEVPPDADGDTTITEKVREGLQRAVHYHTDSEVSDAVARPTGWTLNRR